MLQRKPRYGAYTKRVTIHSQRIPGKLQPSCSSKQQPQTTSLILGACFARRALRLGGSEGSLFAHQWHRRTGVKGRRNCGSFWFKVTLPLHIAMHQIRGGFRWASLCKLTLQTAWQEITWFARTALLCGKPHAALLLRP